ncbi:MAG: potassium-transporting ATPase subunit KdpC [Candidatus Hydrogenedentes bacterium]|nr:potassium-transporting ATPase subunit KdpC [Candidatus Hydrogenedentota bacterium]
MFKEMRQAVSVFLALTVITGLAYPLLVTGVAQMVFPRQANGSLIECDGVVVGSSLIGQTFADPKYFWGRPSATSPSCNAAASSGSNLGPFNPALHHAVKQRCEALRAADPDNKAPIPIDLVTASGSGLDPDISIAGAMYQAGRIARARGLELANVEEMIAGRASKPLAPGLSEPTINVLELNLALDGKL